MTSTARLNMESYESFMRSEYGSKMDYIQPYIDQARQGMDVDYAAFQLKYKAMLKALDKPWSGKIRILFFKFTMEWFKGEIDGTRYIEDEMYAVYTACMEYGNAKKDQDSAEKALRSQVRDIFESLVTQWNTYLTLQELVETAKETQDRILVLNRAGKATYEETADAQQSYQDAQMDALDALKAYYPGTYEGRGEGHVIVYTHAGGSGFITVPKPKVQLAVGTLQAFLDDYLKANGGEVDYIHGDEVTDELGAKPGNIGFKLPAMGKEQLFKTVMADGVLPRKTFSMGHAQDKRYYVEARKIR